MSETTKAPEGAVLPNLGDRAVIEDLLRAYAMAVSQRLARASRENQPREAVVAADQRAAAFLAATLLGKNPAYQASQALTSQQIVKNLRGHLADTLKLYEIEEKEAADDTVFMQFAAFALTNQIHELINELIKNPDTVEQKGAVRLSELVERWVRYITEEKP